MSRADKAISRAQNVIWKEIGRISARIDGLKEKYPPDMFGGKWEDKAFDLDADRDKLKRYLERMKQAEQDEFDRITAEDKLAHMYVKLQAYRNALAEVDPFALQKLDRRFRKVIRGPKDPAGDDTPIGLDDTIEESLQEIRDR